MHPCLTCNKTIGNEHKFCSHACVWEKKHNDYIIRWKAGLETGLTGKHRLEISDHLIWYFRKKYNNKCAECGWNKVNITTGKVPLELHHIDGNWENNTEENITLLCGCCHSLTPTYRALNRGKGRNFRNIRPA